MIVLTKFDEKQEARNKWMRRKNKKSGGYSKNPRAKPYEKDDSWKKEVDSWKI